MRKLFLILLSGITALCVTRSGAQVPGATQSQQLETVEQRRLVEERAAALTVSNAPSLYAGEDADVGPQSVLEMNGRGRAPTFEAFADAQYFYTDNMFFTDKNRQRTDVLVSTVQGALNAARFDVVGGEFVQRFGYRHQWFDYGLADHTEIQAYDFNTGTFRTARLHDFDFNAETLFADGTWKSGNWVAGLAFDFQRLMDTDKYHQFYRELTPRWGLKRIVPICSRSALTLGYQGDYRATDTDAPPPGFNSNFNDRTDHTLFADATYAFCKYAIGQTYYRFQYTYFTGSERRQDYLNSFGLALYCPFNETIGLRFFAGYELLRTNGKLVTNYERLDTGVGLNLMMRF
jgi:hypothetical protein